MQLDGEDDDGNGNAARTRVPGRRPGSTMAMTDGYGFTHPDRGPLRSTTDGRQDEW